MTPSDNGDNKARRGHRLNSMVYPSFHKDHVPAAYGGLITMQTDSGAKTRSIPPLRVTDTKSNGHPDPDKSLKSPHIYHPPSPSSEK